MAEKVKKETQKAYDEVLEWQNKEIEQNIKEEKFNLGDSLLKEYNNSSLKQSSVGNEDNITSSEIMQDKNDIFAEKKRDDYLIRQAKIQLKGGATEKEVSKVLDLIAQSVSPPFTDAEREYAVEKSIFDASQRDRKWTEEVKEWIAVTTGNFSVTNCYNELQAVTSKDKAAIRAAIKRLLDKNYIEKYGKQDGNYRRIDTSIEVIDWQNAEIDPLGVYIPMGLDKKAIVEKKSVILLAGVSNQGKSGFTLDFAKANKDIMPTRYFASEWSPSGLKSRLSKFKENMKVWEGINFIDRNGDFADVIDPDGINIIDFLETHDDAWKASGEIKAMFDKLVTGICVINLQKNPGSTFGKGGHGTMEKPQIYLTIDDGYMTVQKIKQPPDDVMNITGLSRKYTYGPGGALVPDGSWGRLEKKMVAGKEVKELEVLGWANDVINWDEKMG